MTEIITIAEDHSISYSSGAFVLNLTIDNQNAVDRIEFVLPESVGATADWAWRVEISQNGETSWVALADDVVWVPRAGAVTYGRCELQLVGVQPAEDGSYNRVWKSRVFKANVLESINAIVDAEQASELDDIVLKVEGYKDAAEASAQAAASSASAAQAAQTEAEAAQDAAEDAQSAAETAQGKAEAAQTAAETARAGAETARTQAQEAQNAAVTAQGKAEDAQEAAEAAQASAEAAAEDLSAAVASAAQSASSAAQSATDASGYASAASSSATTAAGSATTAQGHASAAQTARAGAESAQSAAETAQGLAEDAQEAAETARDAAQNAQSAAESAKSGAEAAKSDAETAKTAAETAAGNASDDADTAASNASAAAQSAQAAQEAAQTALGIIDDEAAAADSTWSSDKISAEIETISPEDESVGTKPWSSKQIIDVLCPPLEESGNPVQCYPVAGYPLGVKASWSPRQEGSGDPSPDNVREIGGIESIFIEHLANANILNVNAAVDAYNQHFADSYSISNDGVITSNKLMDASWEDMLTIYDFYMPAGEWVLCCDGANPYIELGSKNGIHYNLYNTNKTKISLEIPQRFGIKFLNALGIYPAEIGHVWIEPYTDNPVYRPYTGATATLSLPSTVYGGEVDMATGEGSNRVLWLELAVANMNNNEDFPGWRNVPDLIKCVGSNWNSPLNNDHFISCNVCSNADAIGANTINPAVPMLFMQKDSFGLTQSQWKDQYPDLTVQIALKLNDPEPFQATGGQVIPALSGENVLITNADSLTVTGRADPNHTIQTLSDRIAALEDEIAEGGTNA